MSHPDPTKDYADEVDECGCLRWSMCNGRHFNKIEENKSMKTAVLHIRRTLQAKVNATQVQVKVKFPKQSLGVIDIQLVTPAGLKTVKQFELWLLDGGEKLKAEALI